MGEQEDRKQKLGPETVNHSLGGAIQDTEPVDLERQRQEREREERGNAWPKDKPGFGQGA